MNLDPLLAMIRRLRDPDDGCPWDAEQTLPSMIEPLREETEELAEAIRSGDDAAVAEEFGDVLWNLLFMLTLAEDEGRFAGTAVIEKHLAKMVARHPHVFGDDKAASAEEAIARYQAAKRRQCEGKD